MGHGHEKVAAKRVARAYEERTGGDTIQRAGGACCPRGCVAARRPQGIGGNVGTERSENRKDALHEKPVPNGREP